MLSVTRKLSLLGLALAGSLVAASSWAAQDQALIQETRKNQLSHQAEQPAFASSSASAKPALDHGPRAQVTPWVNRQRKAAQDAQYAAKHESSQQSSGTQ